MSTVHHYKSNLRDLSFNLFEFLDVGSRALGRGPFEGMDEETARESLKALEKLCVGDIAASFAAADLNPPYLDADGVVKMPPALQKALDTYFSAGWHLFELPPHLGGPGAPPTLIWAAFELVAGSNPAAAFLLFGSFIAKVIDRLATPSQKARFLPQMVERCWGGAMVLTEPDAGSDVGSARSSARHVEGDVWEIEGTKRFITNGDYDTARTSCTSCSRGPKGAQGGTKGLSMFIVPKYWVKADGAIGARNGWRVHQAREEDGHQGLGHLRGELRRRGPCRGLLVGEVHDGIRQMFHVIEQARMAVGMKTIATLSTAYLNALAYAKERVQGPDLAHAADKASPRVPHHRARRRAPDAHAPEGPRRGHARARALHRVAARRGRAPGRSRRRRPAPSTGSTTCCCRS
jgi:alkylation response protein AidB-like acyl-CoA dehydrogenase